MLTQEQRTKLKNAGYSDAKINAFEAKKAIQEVEAQPKQPTFLGNVAREVVKPLAKLGTSVVNLAETVAGKETTQPFSGDYLGDVERIGKNFDPTKGFTPENIAALKDAAKTGMDIGLLIEGGGATKNIAKAGIKEGIKTGVKAGAKTGSIIGGIGGASTGLEEDATLADTLKNTAIGAAGGAVAGGVVGGATGAVSGTKKLVTKVAKDRAAKEASSYLDNITPKTNELTPTEYENLLRKGKISPKTTTEPARYILSKKEIATANKYKNLISDRDPVKNSISIIDEISKKDKRVGNFLKKNNGVFNDGELKNFLTEKMRDLTDLTIDASRLDSAKQTMIQNFVASLKKNNMESLWTSRKAFDSAIEKAFSGSPTLQKEIKKALRNGVQDFIAERTPKGVYKTAMKEMSELFDLQEIVSTKASKEKSLNALSAWMKRNPAKAKLIGGAVGTGALTGIGASLLK